MSAATDTYFWRPLMWATSFAAAFTVGTRMLTFLPVGRSGTLAFALRDALELGLIPLGAFLFVFMLGLAIVTVVCLGRGRFHRGASLVCATAVIPLVLAAQPHCTVCSPYFWYVVVNRARLEEAALPLSGPRVPTFTVLETRDVSVGLTSSPPIFASIVYDDSGEIGRDPEQRSEDWQNRNGQILRDALYGDNGLSTEHLIGSFYLVWSTF